MTKKLMALLLAVLMAVSLLPMPAMAGDAQVITDLSGISAGGSYVVDKSVKDIVLSAPLTLDKDVTLELTGQTVTLKLADGESYADASVFHVESGSLTLKGSGTVKVPDNASGVVVAKDAAVTILEKDCTAEKVMAEIQSLLADKERRENMSKTLRSMVRLDSTQRICDIVEELAGKR